MHESMEKIVVGFLGCGNIGCGVYKLLETYGARIEENEGVGFDVRKILVRSLNKSRAWAIPSTLLTDRPEDVLDNPEIDMVMEFMGGEQPAASYMVRALENGKCVITANKMALATHWTQIVRAAREHAAGLYYEASVCGAVVTNGWGSMATAFSLASSAARHSACSLFHSMFTSFSGSTPFSERM